MIINNNFVSILIAIIILSPLFAALIVGCFGKFLKNVSINYITISSLILSFIITIVLSYNTFINKIIYSTNFYQWISISKFLNFNIGFTLNKITMCMTIVILFISILVHIYSIKYMNNDKGYSRFFAYISGFTFAMLCLVMGDNFLLLFFGWELVGLFSYLLIGFYFNKNKATIASLRALITNRIGDLGFLLGIGAIISYTQTIEYNKVFIALSNINNTQNINFLNINFSPIDMICLLLFIGAIGKSAQIPLHSWLEGSMEGPTPVSALIHSATMVAAGVFMIARLSPIFILSHAVLSFILIIGATTCLSMALIAIVQIDIKKIIAYCTISQLGYMMVAQGSGAFSIGMFHLISHAIFKALLFLSAGSIILSTNHEQNINQIGNLKKHMPITYTCMLIGSCTLAGFPPFSGFFSKDLIIEATRITTIYGHNFAYYIILSCTFITSFYIFRMFFITFHSKEKLLVNKKLLYKESNTIILIPLIILSIFSIFIGMYFFKNILSEKNSIFENTINLLINTKHNKISIINYLSNKYSKINTIMFIKNSINNTSFWLSLSGCLLSYILYVLFPNIPKILINIKLGFNLIYYILIKKYFIDIIYNTIFVNIFLTISNFLWNIIDILFIDRIIVNGISNAIYCVGNNFRKIHRGYVFDYAFIMIVSILIFIIFLMFI